jgi:DNA-binding transcriptional regulator LsrR (DeoR family)
LIARPTFNLPLTQDQIGDHLGLTMVHVSRTLRRLREDKVALVDRQVVTHTGHYRRAIADHAGGEPGREDDRSPADADPTLNYAELRS